MIGLKTDTYTVLGVDKKNERGDTFLLCQCVCGNHFSAITGHLKQGAIKRCRECAEKHKRTCVTKHGMRQTRTYDIWCGIKGRCKDKNDKWYGAKGISVCERWSDFRNFLADMGEAPEDKSIDRINNDLGYSPDNCRWATDLEQAANRKCQKFFELNGEVNTLPQWSIKLGIPYRTLMSRMVRSGMTFEDAIGHKHGEITEQGRKRMTEAVTKSNIRRGRYNQDKTVSGIKV